MRHSCTARLVGVVATDRTLYIGIDPGLHGAVGFLYPNGSAAGQFAPTRKVKQGRKERLTYDICAMRDLLRQPFDEYRDMFDDVHVCVEQAQAMPKQGVVSMFSIGVGYGLWQGLLVGSQLAYTTVRPAIWKKVMVPNGPDKAASLKAARKRWPKVDFSLAKDEAVAEALLIAAYAKQMKEKPA